MPSISTPAIIAAGIGAAGSIGSSLINSGSTKQAANTETAAANNASAIQSQLAQQLMANEQQAGATGAAGIGDASQLAQQIYAQYGPQAAALFGSAGQQAQQQQLGIFNQTSSNLAPYMSAGTGALSQLSSLLGLGGTGPNAYDITNALSNTPGYQFQRQQGLQAVNSSGAARGLLNSGSTIKNATTFGQGLAGTTLNNYIAQLTGLAGSGQTAATNLGQFGVQTGSQLGASLLASATGQAGALGTSAAGQAGALTGGASGISGALLSGAGGVAGPVTSGTGGAANSIIAGGNAAGSGQLASTLDVTGGLNNALNSSLQAYLTQSNQSNTAPQSQSDALESWISGANAGIGY